MKASARVCVSGPLAEHVPAFAASLAKQGYTDLSLANQLRLVAHFSRWLAGHRLDIEDLTPSLVDRYLRVRRRTRACWRSRRGLAPLFKHLGLTDTVAHPAPRRSELLERYREYLVADRGLSAGVCSLYETVAVEFLDGREPTRLSRADVLNFVRLGARSPNFAARLTALRSVLRFLHLSGKVSAPLAAVIPSAPGWRRTSLPKALSSAQVDTVLDNCDRRTVRGCRNYAVILLMLRLGLRACEVAALTLDDVNWADGEMVVRGKGGSISRMPLPLDVGRALVAYLRRRGRLESSRALFLCLKAPRRAVSVAAVRGLARCSLRRGGVLDGGGHRLRHTVATLMLRRGGSLTEIAQVLRHRNVNTTAIYAKVDHHALCGVAQPWPCDNAVGPESIRLMAGRWPGGAK
jgi:site-specific recombinase XerC